MGLQAIQGKLVYVVDFDTMPELPIVGTGFEQRYAEALTKAINYGMIREPGKYGIEIHWDTDYDRFDVYRIDE